MHRLLLIGLLCAACGGQETAPAEPSEETSAPSPEPAALPAEETEPVMEEPEARDERAPAVGDESRDEYLDALARTTEHPESCRLFIDDVGSWAAFFQSLRDDATETSVRCEAAAGGECVAELSNTADADHEFAAWIRFMIVGMNGGQPQLHVLGCELAG